MNKRSRTDFIVVHCSATRSTQLIGADAIREWHLAKGWNDIGYHAVIRRTGTIEFGRHFDAVGAHVVGYNGVSVGICLVGGYGPNGESLTTESGETKAFTDDQMTALYRLLTILRSAYPRAKIVGHRDLSPDKNMDGRITRNEWMKDCPTFDVRRWLEDLDPGLMTVVP